MTTPGRVMALDIGDVRTGVAVSDPMRIIASPHSVVQQPSRQKAVDEIVGIVRELEPVLIVVGLPLVGDDECGPQAKKVMAFVDVMRGQLDVEIVFQDERYTTISAEEVLVSADMSRKKRKNVVDKIAATHILQAWMLENTTGEEPHGEQDP
jgi:putative Holliday junction resolvase